MNIAILLRLLFAHILSDFILQTNRINYGKKGLENDGKSRISTRAKYRFQLLHSLTHAATAYLFVAQWGNWIIPLVILATHFVMDWIKSKYMKEGITSFVIDQSTHIAVLLLLWLTLFGQRTALCNACEWISEQLGSVRFLSILAAYTLLLKPASVFLSLFIKRWTPAEPSSEASLPNAGRYIGYLERILILTFILTDNLACVGFLLAAKSVFRFGDLNRAKDIKKTEYVLIGTLASFTTAIIVGFAVQQVS